MSITYFKPTVKLISITQPIILNGAGRNLTPEEFIVYVARISNPANQLNTSTAPKLIKYLLGNGHYSPLELCNLVFEIETTRDISRQILRHEFRPQEFSQRYAEVDPEPAYREARLQDPKNRQNSITTNDTGFQKQWRETQNYVWTTALANYKESLREGIAKEQARALLPEGLTRTTLMGNWNLRNLIFYVKSREGEDTQKEHRMVAHKIKAIVKEHFPNVSEALGW